MPSSRDVVVTGMGCVCPLGVGAPALWSALAAGKSGVGYLDELQGIDSPFRFAARIHDFDARQHVQPRKTIKVMCQEIQTAFASASMAMEQAGLAKGAIDPERFGVVMGSEMLYGELEEIVDVYRHCSAGGEFRFDQWGDYAFKDLFPLWMLKYLPNMAACHISIAHDARGPNNSIVEGGASSLLAIIEAASAIERGHADVMLAGGSGSIASFSCLPFRGWKQLSKWDGQPAAASRPFDARRSGLVPGEGAAMLLLESRDHAQLRGAKILARLAGRASSFEPPGNPWAERTGRAIKQSIVAAMADAEISPADLGHVNAHGESTIAQDRQEAQAIRETLGDVPVIALKSYFGDLAAGSGAVEAVGSLLAMEHGQLPPVLNYEHPDPACPINVVSGQMQPLEKPAALLLNQSNTGQSAAIVFIRE
jgi:3-oxoacyl-[acyl-carrier-protein] synthase II